MSVFNYFKGGIGNVNPDGTTTLAEVVEWIRSDTYKKDIEAVRAQTSKKAADFYKKSLDYVTFSGTFSTRLAPNLLRHSGYVAIDIDDLADAPLLKTQIASDSYVAACFLSPRGNGLKVIVAIADITRHKETFADLAEYFNSVYRLEGDEKVDMSGSDVSRALYLSYDPECYYNPKSEVYAIQNLVQPKPVVTREQGELNVAAVEKHIETVVQRIEAHGMDICNDYGTEWLLIAFSMATIGESGREFFHRISRQNGKYNVKDADAKFDNALATTRFTTPAKFFSICKDYGVDISRVVNVTIVDGKEVVEKLPAARYEKRDATEEEKDGQYLHVEKEWTTDELKMIFTGNIWKYLMKKNLNASKKEVASDEIAYREAKAVCSEYYLSSLLSYSKVVTEKGSGKTVVHTWYSTAAYPILMFDKGQWKKFFFPAERNLGRRNFSTRVVPDHTVWGLTQVVEACNDLSEKDREESDDPDEQESKKKTKLPEAFICRNETIGLCLAAIGFLPMWLESPKGKLMDFDKATINGNVETVYNLPDYDAAGMKAANAFALEHMDIHTIFIDVNQKLRLINHDHELVTILDYFKFYKAYDFKQLLTRAYPLRFWDEEFKKSEKGKKKYITKYVPNNELIYNFLYRMGFGLIEMPSEKDGEMMIKIDAHVVKKVKYSNVNRFVKEFLKQKNYTIDLINAFHRSPHFSEKSLANIPYVQLPFDDHDEKSQYIFARNEIWKITADGVHASKPETCDRFVWEEEVIPHDVTKLPRSFTIWMNDRTGKWDIRIHRTDCLFLRFAINASRVYWRTELEERLDKRTPEEKAEYLEYAKFVIDGVLLTEEEIQEQKQHLISKLISFGYLLHRYKDPANAFCVWAVDYNIPNTEDSNGGSGKSLYYTALFHLMKYEYFDGRNDKLTLNPHIYESITEHTDLMYVDDAGKYFNFDFFFPVVTGPLKINPKGTQGRTIRQQDVPKLCITSNFPPRKNDKTTRRRLWFTAFSDYYHKNPNGEYREERLPKDDFGKTLFTQFTEEEWNYFLNTAAECIQDWMTFGQVEPPMETLMMNQYKSAMGETFHAWADAYFGEESERLDTMVPRYMAFETYKRECQPTISPQGFMEKMRNWCFFKGYNLNPEAAITTKDGRIMNWMPKMEYVKGVWIELEKKVSVPCLYIQTDEDIEITKASAPSSDLPF